MKHSLLKNVIWVIAACAGVAALCATVAFAQGAGVPASPSQSTAQTQPAAQQGQRTDGQIEMDVVHALDAEATLKNDLITAATIQGEVTLSGTVSSEASKKLAGSIAASISGVTKVQNNLKVGNPNSNTGNLQPAPDTQEMPDSGQPQNEQGTAGLPPAGEVPYPGANQPQNGSQAPAASPYPQQGGYPSYPQQRPQYPSPQYSQYPQQYGQPYGSAPAEPQEPQYTPASGPVTLPAGTLIQLRTSEPVDSRQAQPGQPVQFVVIQDVSMGGVLAIPRGAVVHGVVTDSQNAGSGKMAGSSSLALTLTSLDLGGRNYPLHTDQFRVVGPNKAGQTVGSAAAGGLIGTMIGCIVGRGVGCAIGAGAGAAAGTAAGTAAPGARVWIPSEALVTFHLADPLTVQPVSPQEAQRLAQGLYPGGPTLYRRHNPYYASPYVGYGYGYGPAYYGYPAPFYRPYYMMGGMYFWR